jgi:hypothetical protein
MLTTFVILFVLFYITQKIDGRKKKNEGVQIEMIRAKILLLSSSPIEISNFLELKEPYLTEDMINQLINRIAELKADETINNDWNTKLTRIAVPEVIDEEFAPQEESVMKR